MSLTITAVTEPAGYPVASVTNMPNYTVTTDIVEGSSYNNVRVRANIYIDGIVKAVLEQPKGLSSFDFFNILKAFTGKLNTAPSQTTPFIQPTYGSELLTGWTNIDFTTLTTAGRAISAAIKAAGSGWVKSNNLGALAVGDILVIGTEHDYALGTATVEPSIYLTDADSVVTGHEFVIPLVSKIRFIMVTTTMAASQLTVGRASGAQSWAGTWTVKLIPAASTSHKGYPCVYFKIGFTEYYEDATGATVIGTESLQKTLLFVPAITDNLNETLAGNYTMLRNVSVKKFLNDSIRSGMEFKRSIRMDVKAMFVSEETYIKLWLTTTARGNVAMSATTSNMGWGFININEYSLYGAEYFITTDTADTSIYLSGIRANDVTISETLTLKQVTKCYPKINAVEFVGSHGMECILFKGSPTIKNITEKEFYKNVNRVNLPYVSDRKKQIVLRSLYETDAYNEILWQLINSTSVMWMFDLLLPYYKIIGINTDEITEYDQTELFINEILAEYV